VIDVNASAMNDATTPLTGLMLHVRATNGSEAIYWITVLGRPKGLRTDAGECWAASRSTRICPPLS